MYLVPGRGWGDPGGQNFDANRKALLLCHFFYLIHVYIPRAGADNPMGKVFDANRKALLLCPIILTFKIIFEDFWVFLTEIFEDDIAIEANFQFAHYKSMATKSVWARAINNIFAKDNVISAEDQL